MKAIILLLFFLFSSLFANEKVVLQLKWLHQFQFAGYYAAFEKGFYKDAGLDVEIRERDIEKNNIQQVIDGEVDYSIADSVLLLYKAKGDPVVIVAPIFQHSPNILMTLKSSGLDSPYDLKNKDITFYKENIDGFGIFAMLKSLDVKPAMTRIKDQNSFEDLINGKTDAYPGYLTNEPFTFKEMGFDVNIIDPTNYGFDLYGDMLFTNSKEATEHPQRVEKFKQASLKGWEYAFEHKEEIVELIKNKYAKNKSLKHLRYEADALEQVIHYKSIPLGTLDKGRIEYALNMYKKYGFIENTVPIEDFIFDSSKKEQNVKSFLTNEERAYLEKKKVIQICIDPNWTPLEYSENGEHKGVSADYMSIIEKSIGTPIRMVKTQNWSESVEFVKEHKCDMVPLIMPTKEREAFLEFSKPYLSVPSVIVTNLDELYVGDLKKFADKKIGVVKDYTYIEILKRKYPKMSFTEVESVRDGLEKVKDGKLFGFIDALSTVGYLIQKDYIGQLKVAGKFDESWDMGIGARKDEPMLTEIFDKALELIPASKKQEILNKWISVNYDRSTNYKVVFTWVGVVALLFSTVLAVVLYVNRKLSKEIQGRKEIEKKLEAMTVTDELTSLYNRRYFNEIFPKLINSAKREAENIGFAILDIDYFKQYNDTYGHIAGDEVLKTLAISMRHSMQRADDYCFRLGGEEFGVLFKGLNKEEAKTFINTMKQNIENLHIKHESSRVSSYVTASFGLVVKDAHSIKSENELYKEADMFLYEAKESGRNRVCSN